MKKHILSSYAKKDFKKKSENPNGTTETRTIEQNDNDLFFSVKKGTIKTFSIESTDTDDQIMLNTTDKKKDSTETIENTDVYTYLKVEGTRLTKSIENSDDDFEITNKKTRLTETIENSDDVSFFVVHN